MIMYLNYLVFRVHETSSLLNFLGMNSEITSHLSLQLQFDFEELMSLDPQ